MNKFLTPILIVILIIIFAAIFFPKNNNTLLKNPLGNVIPADASPSPVVSNYNPPKEIKYDANTNLENELEKVDPKVLNSDFDSLKSL